MLISRWLLPGVLLLVHIALCSDVQGSKSVHGKAPKQLQTESETEYQYNHPPLPEHTEARSSRKEKSIEFSEQITSSPTKLSSRAGRRRTNVKASTVSEIPVKVIYDQESTKASSHAGPTSSPLDKTTRVFVQRRRSEPSNIRKKIDIRQTTTRNTNIDPENKTEKVEQSTRAEGKKDSSTSEFPTRSRDSYFKKRTEPPTPKVKILNEQNFVYSHSGNFHYSFLGGDGTQVSSQGELRSYPNNKTGEAVSGNVFYTDKDGNDYSLSYTADENGYRPVGAHLPTPPPLPPAIARALKYIADKSTTVKPNVENEN